MKELGIEIMKGVNGGGCRDADRNRLRICIVGVLIAALVILLLAGSTSSAKILIVLSIFTFVIINVAGITFTQSCTLRFRNILPSSIVFIFSVALLSVTGCVSESNDLTNNETMTTPVTTDTPTTISTPAATNVTPSITLTIPTPPSTPILERIPPKQLYIKAGQIQQFDYHGRNIIINYTSEYPTQIVKITFNGTEKIIQKEVTDSSNAIYWSEGDFSFTLKPVLWEIRDGQRSPVFGNWNTTELYFEVVLWRIP